MTLFPLQSAHVLRRGLRRRDRGRAKRTGSGCPAQGERHLPISFEGVGEKRRSAAGGDFFPDTGGCHSPAGSFTFPGAGLAWLVPVSLDRPLTILATAPIQHCERDLITRLIEDIVWRRHLARMLFCARGAPIRASLHQHGKGGRRRCVEYRTRPGWPIVLRSPNSWAPISALYPIYPSILLDRSLCFR